jgi:hypothetical protein
MTIILMFSLICSNKMKNKQTKYQTFGTVRVTPSLVLYVCFVDRCFFFSIHGFKDLPNECKYRFFLNLHKAYMYVQRVSLILLPVMYIRWPGMSSQNAGTKTT